MMKNKIKRAIYRSEKAYAHYVEDKKYFQALRIYEANKIVYELLNAYLYSCDKKDLDEVADYIFHLEDWFNQFNQENQNIKLNQEFIFKRLEGGIAFPKNFKNKLK